MANQTTTTQNPQVENNITLPVSSGSHAETMEITPVERTGEFEITSDSAALFAEMVEASGKMADMKEVLTLSAAYMELNTPGENFRGIFFGYQQINTTDESTGERREMTAARFIVNRTLVINAGVVLVKECQNARLKEGTPVMVTYKGKEGKVKIYSLTLLAKK